MTSSAIFARSVPGAGCVLAITPNWIIDGLLSFHGQLVEQAPGFALAAVGELAQAARCHQLDRDADAEIRFEAVLQNPDEILPTADVVLDFDLNGHVRAHVEA